jgi:O-antigen ligase
VARARFLLAFFAVIACAYAAFGVVSLAAAPGRVLWLDNPNPPGTVSATFINRNSFATYAGIGFLTVATLLLRLYRHRVGRAARPVALRIVSFIETTGREGALMMTATFIVFAALMMSGSRGGIAATAVGFLVMVVLTFNRGGRRGNEQRDTVLFVVIVAAVTFVAFGDKFLGKIATGAVTDESRMAVYGITLGAILDSPIVGYGYGTFADVFPMFRDQSMSVVGHWEQAHNTYLELLQGLGVLFGLALIACVAILVARCFKGALTRVENASIPALAASAGVLVGLHALVDFSLQIQAVTLTFMALLGAGLAQSESSRIVVSD